MLEFPDERVAGELGSQVAEEPDSTTRVKRLFDVEELDNTTAVLLPDLGYILCKVIQRCVDAVFAFVRVLFLACQGLEFVLVLLYPDRLD